MRLIDADKLKQDDEIRLWLSRDTVRAGKMLKAFSELFVRKIEEQPTVEVAPNESVTEFADRCKECGTRYGKLLKMKSGEWIPVSERLPEDGTWNLFTDGKSVSVERYKSDALDHFFPNGRWFQFDEVVAYEENKEAKNEKENYNGYR